MKEDNEQLTSDKDSNQKTGEKAIKFILLQDKRCFKPTTLEKVNIAIAYALNDPRWDIPETAYDVIRIIGNIDRNCFQDPEKLSKKLDAFQFLESKGTKKKTVKDDFKNFGFSIPEAEMRLALDVGEDKYKFMLVNRARGIVLEVTLSQLRKRAKTYLNTSFFL